MTDITRKRDFPLHYPDEILAIIEAMAFDTKNVLVSGSSSLRSQQYAADYDLYEVVPSSSKTLNGAVSGFVRGFQKNIRQLLALPDCFVGDIKCGEISEWKVVLGDVRHGKVVGYDAEDARTKLTALMKSGVVSEDEYEEGIKLIKPLPTLSEFLELSQVVRPHIVRWSVKDVLRGYTVLRDGRHFTLAEAIQTPAIAKVDCVAFVQKSRFTDFSIIYQFMWKRKVLNDFKADREHELKKNILILSEEGSYYKMAKRIFSYEKDYNHKLIKQLSDLFNSDLGRMYSLISDIKTLLFLLENEDSLPLEKIRYEIDQFRSRLGSIYETHGVGGKDMIKDVIALESESPTKLQKGLSALETRLTRTLNSETAKALKHLRLLPLPKRYLP